MSGSPPWIRTTNPRQGTVDLGIDRSYDHGRRNVLEIQYHAIIFGLSSRFSEVKGITLGLTAPAFFQSQESFADSKAFSASAATRRAIAKTGTRRCHPNTQPPTETTPLASRQSASFFRIAKPGSENDRYRPQSKPLTPKMALFMRITKSRLHAHTLPPLNSL
jgi:hypothetical protein